MRKSVVIACLMIAGISYQPVCAQELSFPQTEAEFVEALRVKPTNLGQTRGLARGLGGITAPTVAPKVGALIHFDFDSDWIKPESYGLLDNFGKALNGGLYDAVFLVVGHTDSSGSDEYNQALSSRRANAVIHYLIDHHGIAEERLVAQGHGESSPIADNHTEDGRFMNRRVEFVRR